ncbi:hypothetical protein PS834_05607 [Pseudomonas fluorescens]|nr:hypothetical protein PS834_05607 [Pseudomonas fluorescens]
MQRMKLVFHQMQRKRHLLVFEVGLNSHLLVSGQTCQQVTDLRTTINQQTRRCIPHVQLRVVLHCLDEIQLVLGEEGVALHG